MSIDNTLQTRQTTYGGFNNNAIIAQQLKAIARVNDPVLQEALDMICSKISRIVTGDQSYVDSWHDIQGYAKLAEEYLCNT